MNKFLKDLENELSKLNVSSEDIFEILEDHKEMMASAKNDGLSEEEINLKFGDPIKVANEIYSDIKDEPKKQNGLKNVVSCVDYDLEDYNLVKTFPVDKNIISFHASLISDDLQYTNYEGNTIQVFEKEINDIQKYEIDFDDNVLTLKKKKTLLQHNSREEQGEFLVLVPTLLQHKQIEFNNISGDVNFNGISTKELSLKSTNGDIEISNIIAIESKFSFVNGNVEMNHFEGSELDISIINGNLSIQDAVFKGAITFNTVSGDVELQNVECNSSDLRTVSGDLEGSEFYPKEISLKSISGDIEINNRDKSRPIKIKHKKTISGNIQIN